MFDFSIVTIWFDELLRQTLGLGNFSAILIVCARRRSHHRGLCRARHHSYFYGT